MACSFVVIFVLPSWTSGSPVYKNHEETKESYFFPKEVVDFTAHISEAGEEYDEKIEVDPNKRTEYIVIHRPRQSQENGVLFIRHIRVVKFYFW